ncbi:MAG: excisionase family DNA-binding protein [Collinsella sp.]|nr:excisionase family DNA-binding protein [Collinsella sp.]
MQLTAECVLIHDDCAWTAEFPALGLATSGRTRDAALKAAREILELEAFDLIEEGGVAPRCRHVAEIAIISVDVTKEDAERARYVTKSEAAERLGVSRPRITALVAAGKLAIKKFGTQELVSLDSIAEYSSSPREAGRPVVALHG